MHLLVDRLGKAQRSLGTRSVFQIVSGTLWAMWGIFCSLLIFSYWAKQQNKNDDFVYAFTFWLVLGLLPILTATYFIWCFARIRRKLKNLRAIAELAWSGAPLDYDSLTTVLRVPASTASAMLFDATEAGVISEHPQGASPESGGAQPMPNSARGSPDGSGPEGQTVGNYHVEQRLASGGMGAIYLARHVRTGRAYALKTLLPDVRSSDPSARRIEREAVVAGAMGHPNIVAVHDYGTFPNGAPFLVMDLLEGETLEQRLGRRGSLTWPEALHIARDVCNGLAAAHDQGLLHRDIKPENIFLENFGHGSQRAVLLDFGLAKPLNVAATRLTATGQALGN